MELQWNQTPCQYLQTNVRQVQNQEQTQELRLPEEMPDIGSVLCAWGQPVLRSKEWRGDGMSVSGGVSASVLYRPEDGSEPRSVDVWIPFQMKWNFAQSRREGTILARCLLRSIDARMLSARKMMVRASVAVLGEGLEAAETMVYAPAEIPSGVEVLKKTYPAVIPREAGEKQFYFEEEFQIPDVKQWLSFRLFPEITEQNVVGNRAVFRGNGQVQYVYMDTQGEIHSGGLEIPFAQFSELDRDYDKEAALSVMPAVTSLETDISPEKVHIHCGVMGQYIVWDRKLLAVAADAYSPHCPVSGNMETLRLPMELERRVETMELQADFPEGRILDMMFLPDFPIQYRQDNQLHLELPGTFQLLYRDGAGDLQMTAESRTAQYTMDVDQNARLLPEPMSFRVTEQPAPTARVNMQLQTMVKEEIPMLTGVTCGPPQPLDPNRPSLILRRMDTESLWELAKESGSTMEAIRQANDLMDEPQPGQLLLIPVS